MNINISFILILDYLKILFVNIDAKTVFFKIY